jgi:hypothetical protein
MSKTNTTLYILPITPEEREEIISAIKPVLFKEKLDGLKDVIFMTIEAHCNAFNKNNTDELSREDKLNKLKRELNPDIAKNLRSAHLDHIFDPKDTFQIIHGSHPFEFKCSCDLQRLVDGTYPIYNETEILDKYSDIQLVQIHNSIAVDNIEIKRFY